MNQAWERKARVLVVGDVFLDKYIYYDPNLSRPSLETGLMTITEGEKSTSRSGR